MVGLKIRLASKQAKCIYVILTDYSGIVVLHKLRKMKIKVFLSKFLFVAVGMAKRLVFV
jgi:hypothetical protein